MVLLVIVVLLVLVVPLVLVVLLVLVVPLVIVEGLRSKRAFKRNPYIPRKRTLKSS